MEFDLNLILDQKIVELEKKYGLNSVWLGGVRNRHTDQKSVLFWFDMETKGYYVDFVVVGQEVASFSIDPSSIDDPNTMTVVCEAWSGVDLTSPLFYPNETTYYFKHLPKEIHQQIQDGMTLWELCVWIQNQYQEKLWRLLGE